MGLRFGCVAGITALMLGLPAFAQPAAAGASRQPPAQTAVALNPPLLPASFANWTSTGNAAAAVQEPSFSLVNADKSALEECVPDRSAVQNYTGGGRTLHVEATQFKDASGASAAFSTLAQPGMHELKGLGTRASEGDGGVLFVEGNSVAVAFPASSADLPALQALADAMPKPVGSQGLLPLLPTLLPARGLQPATLRYALGAQTYMAGGGVLPANGLGWQQSAEAVTGKYADKRGAETLTLFLYPTPTIAGMHQRAVEALLPGLGPSLAKARTRREGSLLIVADGSFSPDATQALVENTHLRQIASTDKAMPTPDVIETRKSFGMLADIIVFSGVLCAGALILGLFLGGGRALVRILQGKPAATEAEFLSLHLEPQNAAPQFSAGKSGDGA